MSLPSFTLLKMLIHLLCAFIVFHQLAELPPWGLHERGSIRGVGSSSTCKGGWLSRQSCSHFNIQANTLINSGTKGSPYAGLHNTPYYMHDREISRR